MTHIDFVEKKFSKRYNNYYSRLKDNFVSEKGETYSWDDKCYIPTALSKFTMILKTDRELSDSDLDRDSSLMSGFAGWKANKKKIVRLNESNDNRNYQSNMIVDIDKLFEKIGHGTFIEYGFKSCSNIIENYFNESIVGALLHIENNMHNEMLELRVNLLSQNNTSFYHIILCLTDGKTVRECILDTLNITDEYKIQLEKEYYLYEMIFSSIFELLLG